MTITAIKVNGTALDLADIDITVGINHGRNDITGGSNPSDASIVIRNFPTIPADIGDELLIEAYGQARFTGDVTNLRLTHEYSPSAALLPVLQIDAIGKMARLGQIYVGEAGYPKADLNIRVAEILDDTGLTYTANISTGNEQLHLDALDGGYSAMQLLTDLCSQTGATMCDLPDGAILIESYAVRGIGYNPAHWYDVTDPWSAVTYIWADVYDRTEAMPLAVDLPHDAVVWAPQWANDIVTIVNDVTVTYNNNDVTTDTDTDSVATYGRRGYTLATRYTTLADAQTRAGDVIRAQAFPRYGLTNVLIQMSKLTEPTLTAVRNLISGSRVNIDNLPQPSPIEDYCGIVEGWSDHYGPDGYFLSLSLSDPRYSYAVLRWSEVTVTETWGTVTPTTQWFNVVNNSDL